MAFKPGKVVTFRSDSPASVVKVSLDFKSKEGTKWSFIGMVTGVSGGAVFTPGKTIELSFISSLEVTEQVLQQNCILKTTDLGDTPCSFIAREVMMVNGKKGRIPKRGDWVQVAEVIRNTEANKSYLAHMLNSGSQNLGILAIVSDRVGHVEVYREFRNYMVRTMLELTACGVLAGLAKLRAESRKHRANDDEDDEDDDEDEDDDDEPAPKRYATEH